MSTRGVRSLVAATAVLTSLATACAASDGRWQREFAIDDCKLSPTGRNPYFILEPGYQLVLEGKGNRLEITVLDETKVVDGVTTRVVEERETSKGRLTEISRNYFAICEATKDVFYFGEDVDNYGANGKVVNHDGSWLAGTGGNRPGLIMPGTPRVGMKYYQEIAPGVAMDRAEIVSVDETCRTPAGVFTKCLKILEGSALGSEREYKYHAPGIGLIRDEDLRLTKHGVVNRRAASEKP